ncbi:MAG: hypothetical protein ACRDPD_05035, partial [Streptosporangiaceae bacterium]
MPEQPTVLRTVIASDNFLTREGLGCLLSADFRTARSAPLWRRYSKNPGQDRAADLRSHRILPETQRRD